jgi:hypothetical protein
MPAMHHHRDRIFIDEPRSGPDALECRPIVYIECNIRTNGRSISPTTDTCQTPHRVRCEQCTGLIHRYQPVHSKIKEPLKTRVIRSAEAALADHGYVSAFDVLAGMRLLLPEHLEAWRKGRIDRLDNLIQGRPDKIAACIATFVRWAEAKGLERTDTHFVRHSRDGPKELRVTATGDPALERMCRIQFVSPALPPKQREKLQERQERAPDPVVFEIIRDSQCSECGIELDKGSFLYMEADLPLCLACARLADLEFLPSGNTALTRRAGKYSERKAVVVRFSRSRGRYERQGILVEQPALAKAEYECTEDAEERANARVRAAEARRKQDKEFVARMTEQLRALFPGCPEAEARSIAEHTAARGSGRVGRSATGRNLEEQAVTAAVVAAVRHGHTNYDELLAGGMERIEARARVAEGIAAILDRWRNPA